ncbi:hypothetical protein RchiOBHm_Chr4g0407461 [Rosa chinensis]|uniref:Uncharacterized protein n=1 Tax=Rosa chinensis TaxID=74649 RepID=A0A2P6QUP7_ROSCH|nr:hypothetical protein RchiOBHm_Chr4g0407461 [Rosa chinensis]
MVLGNITAVVNNLIWVLSVLGDLGLGFWGFVLWWVVNLVYWVLILVISALRFSVDYRKQPFSFVFRLSTCCPSTSALPLRLIYIHDMLKYEY